MLRAVKKTDQTTLDILIDTRLYPSFVMIEEHKDWQEETEEVKDTLEQVINYGADKFNWHVNLQEHHTNTTQHLEEFISALSYMKNQEDMYEKHNNNFHFGSVGQVIMKVDGDNYYEEKLKSAKIENLKKGDEEVNEAEERNEELFHFIHPELEETEAWRVHDAVRRVVAHQRVMEICAYLKELKQNGKLMLPSIPSVMYYELVRLGMPTGEGFSEKNFSNSYIK